MIGNGKQTKVWIDNWIFDGKARRHVGRHHLMNIDLRVTELFNQHSGMWYDTYSLNCFIILKLS